MLKKKITNNHYTHLKQCVKEFNLKSIKDAYENDRCKKIFYKQKDELGVSYMFPSEQKKLLKLVLNV